MKRKILITGGAGNVGGSLARRLVENEDNYVVIVDNLLTGSIDKLPKDCYKNWNTTTISSNWGMTRSIINPYKSIHWKKIFLKKYKTDRS